MPKPELILFLYNNTDRLLKNIESRGREYEQDIKATYLNRIHKNYMTVFRQNRKLRVVVVDASEMDFVNNNSDLEYLLELTTQIHSTGITTI